MKLASVIIATLFASASAMNPHSNIGSRLMAQARRVEDQAGAEEGESTIRFLWLFVYPNAFNQSTVIKNCPFDRE